MNNIIDNNRKINEERRKRLRKIVRTRNESELKKFILEKVEFKYRFSNDNFMTEISKFHRIKKEVFNMEKRLGIPLKHSLIYKVSVNLFDNNFHVRNYYNWKCQICNIDCSKDKDLLDAHINAYGLRGNKNKNLIQKNDTTVCCRLCHYNIDPKTHFNLILTDSIKQRIYKLRENHKKDQS